MIWGRHRFTTHANPHVPQRHMRPLTGSRSSMQRHPQPARERGSSASCRQVLGVLV